MFNVPETGFMYDFDEGGSEHSHHLYITTWDGQPVHTNEFKGVTSFDVGHDHPYAGITEPAPSGIQHTHRYFIFTTVDDRHKHVIRGGTGPAIFLPGEGHYHEYSGVTSVDGAIPHRHKYSGRTSL